MDTGRPIFAMVAHRREIVTAPEYEHFLFGLRWELELRDDGLEDPDADIVVFVEGEDEDHPGFYLLAAYYLGQCWIAISDSTFDTRKIVINRSKSGRTRREILAKRIIQKW